MSSPKIIAAVPAFNVEATIAKVVVLAKKYVSEIIVCDDGSSDSTADIARNLGADVIVHDRNRGYGAALASLFRRAKEDDADILVTLDGDGQHDAAEIPRIIKPLIERQADIVVGSRLLSRNAKMPGYRRIGIKAITKLSDVVAYNGLTDAQSGFRAYSGDALEILAPSEMGMGASTEILAKARGAGMKVIEVPITVSYGTGSSTHNPAYHGLDVVLSTVKLLSIRHPLGFYGLPGFALLLVAGGFWYWTLVIYAAKGTVFTNVALVAVVSTVLGVLLMAIAVILWVLISVIREGKTHS